MSTTSSSPADPLPDDFELSFDLSQFLNPDHHDLRHSRGTTPTNPKANENEPVVNKVSVPSTKNSIENWRDSCMIPTDKLGYILEKGIWHDVKFKVGDPSCAEIMSAHKLILAMSSAVFEAMLFGPLSNAEEEMIEIPDVDPYAFSLMLKVYNIT